MKRFIVAEVLILLVLQIYVIAQGGYEDPAAVAKLSGPSLNDHLAEIEKAGMLEHVDTSALTDANLKKYANKLSKEQIQSVKDPSRLKLLASSLTADRIKDLDGKTQLTILLPEHLNAAQKLYLQSDQLSDALLSWQADFENGETSENPLRRLGDLGLYNKQELAIALADYYHHQQPCVKAGEASKAGGSA